MEIAEVIPGNADNIQVPIVIQISQPGSQMTFLSAI
jgi:hypothetical protein